jgi:hypothetical protein
LCDDGLDRFGVDQGSDLSELAAVGAGERTVKFDAALGR